MDFRGIEVGIEVHLECIRAELEKRGDLDFPYFDGDFKTKQAINSKLYGKIRPGIKKIDPTKQITIQTGYKYGKIYVKEIYY